jgi:HK97 family phage portal protein
VFKRSIRPPDDISPNPNDPVTAAPGTVGPDQAVNPGDPHGVVLVGDSPPMGTLPTIIPSAWSGWPADWWTPSWGTTRRLVDIAWICVDTNAEALMQMPPYLTGARTSLNADWLNNPNPDLYTSWEEFAKQVFWDFQLGEVFVVADSRYATGYPARFHVVPQWAVSVEMGRDGLRRYTIGDLDVTPDMLHIRYKSTVGYAHGEGPLEAVQARVGAALALMQYATTLATSGGIPSSILMHPEELSAEQAALLQAQWVQSRLSTLGEPAVLSGGVTWEATQMDPEKMALVDLTRDQESRIAVAFRVPPFLVGLPSGSDSMTYKTIQDIYEYHWRVGLRPKAQAVMSAISQWALPRGVRVELNRDAYVEADPHTRAMTYQILASIIDPVTGQPVMSVQEIRGAERLDNSVPEDLSAGVLK